MRRPNYTVAVACLALGGGLAIALTPLRGAAQTAATVAGAKSVAKPAATSSAPKPTPTTVSVVDAFGTVERQGPNEKSWRSISVGDVLPVMTTVRTGDSAACLVRLNGGHVLRIGAKSLVELRQLGQDNQYSFKVLSGQVWSMVRKANHPSKYEVETPSAVAGVTGTIFGVSLDPSTGATVVSTDEGSVNVRQDGSAAVPVARGFFTRVGPVHPGMRRSPFTPQKQDEKMQHMWLMLHQEGVLIRTHEIAPFVPTFPFRLQRRIEPKLWEGWHHGYTNLMPGSARPLPPDPNHPPFRRGPMGGPMGDGLHRPRGGERPGAALEGPPQ